MNTCRFCKEQGFEDRDFVRYGLRHYAHWQCFLDAGRSLADLSKFQRGRVPLWMLRNNPGLREILDEANAKDDQ